MSKGVGDCFRSNVNYWNGDRPTREAVNYRQQVAETIGRSQRDNVHVEVREPLRRYFKVSNRRRDVTRDFSLLTWYTFTGPAASVGLDGRPDKTFGYRLLSAVYAGVSESVNCVEDTTAPLDYYFPFKAADR